MLKSALAVIAVVTLVVACVNVAGPTGEPSITPPAATATTASTPSPTATPGPTAAPSASAAPSPTSAPSPEPTGALGFDQRDVDFFDDLGDDDSGWGSGATDGGSVAYVDGALRFETSQNGAWLYSSRQADSASATMRIIGDFYPTNAGRFGPVCASGGDLFGAIVGTDGSWNFVQVGNNGAEVLFGDDSATLDVHMGQSNLVALECAGTATGNMRLTLWVGESGPVGTWTQSSGPRTFDEAIAYVQAFSDGFRVDMDNVVVFGSGISDGSFSADGEELLAHVPADWQDSCYQGIRPPYLALIAEAVVSCFVSSENTDGVELAEYASFASAADMEAAYQRRIDAFGTGGGADSCADGSGEHGYTIGNVDAGRLLCVDQFAGIRFDWTDSRLNILSSMTDFDGDYAATLDDWLSAGPDL